MLASTSFIKVANKLAHYYLSLYVLCKELFKYFCVLPVIYKHILLFTPYDLLNIYMLRICHIVLYKF